ncbi:MAG: hypothetical protein HY884_05490 [Deltaproteobacteria bacterium]|nr:hypothetical protein [Deltaproteobacteria bacterium]
MLRMSTRGDITMIAVSAAVAVIFAVLYYKLLICSEIFIHDSIIWYGSFHYFIESLGNLRFPYWDPYLISGTYFYPNISHMGLLDPVVLISAFSVKVFGISALTAYVYFRLVRLFIFVIGAYLLFKHLTKQKSAAALAAGGVLLAVTPSYLRQMGVIDNVFLTPLAMFFLLLFFECIETRRRYLHLAVFTLITGVTMNVFIPSFYLFNIVFFALGLFLFKIVDMRRVLKNLVSTKLLTFVLGCVVITMIMAAPPAAVMYFDASGGGELFPMQRIIQKNNLQFKKIAASGINSASLSGEFTGQRGVFSSYGNALSLLYQDMWKSFSNPGDWFSDENLISETFQYFGMVPLILAVIGLIYTKSRLRFVCALMLVLVSLNMFSGSGVDAKPFNAAQKAFNAVFPPLKMLEVRETLNSFIFLYLGLLMSFGLSLIFDGCGYKDFFKEKYHGVIVIGLALIFVKAGLTAYLFKRAVFKSSTDELVMLAVVFFVISAAIYSRGLFGKKFFFAVIAALVLTDLYLYNDSIKGSVLKDSATLYGVINDARPKGGKNEFEYLRAPYGSLPDVAFGESLTMRKGALSRGYNHSLFTTKRYYDLLTNAPLANQFVLNGVTSPILGFYPLSKVRVAQDRNSLLDRLGHAAPEELDGFLYVEKDGKQARREGSGQAETGLGDLSKFEDVLWLKNSAVDEYWKRFSEGNVKAFAVLKDSIAGGVKAFGGDVKLIDFNVNGITVLVKNKTQGYLLYNDGWSRHWKAYVNGNETPIATANYNGKAVYLEKGEHTVVMSFEPRLYMTALVLYYLGLAVSVGVITVEAFKKRAGEKSA